MKLTYITVETGQSLKDVISSIKRNCGNIQYYSLQYPDQLSGNFKILTLKSKNSTNIVKIDGPGFIIDELFAYFSYK